MKRHVVDQHTRQQFQRERDEEGREAAVDGSWRGGFAGEGGLKVGVGRITTLLAASLAERRYLASAPLVCVWWAPATAGTCARLDPAASICSGLLGRCAALGVLSLAACGCRPAHAQCQNWGPSSGLCWRYLFTKPGRESTSPADTLSGGLVAILLHRSVDNPPVSIS